MPKALYLLLFSFVVALPMKGQVITTVAGGGIGGLGDGGAAVSAQLVHPVGIAVDGVGNLFIADRDNHRIRKVDISGVISTIAGTGTFGFSGDGGAATLAKINSPRGIAVDAVGNVYFADVANQRIRKITTSGTITTIAGTGISGYNGDNIAASTADLSYPDDVAVDNAGNIYISDFNNNRIRKVNSGGVISTCAGVGISGYNGDSQPATIAQLDHPYGIALDNSGNLFIADFGNYRIRKVSNSGIIITVAGNGTTGYSGDGGPATTAQMAPNSIEVDGYGNIYITDAINHVARKILPNGIIETIAGIGFSGYNGDNIVATTARLSNPTDITTNANGSVYIADFGNQRIRYINSTVGINNIISLQSIVTLYPNPAINQVNIISAQAIETITITDITGKDMSILPLWLHNKRGNYWETTINIGHLPPGLYLATVNGVYAGRFVKE